MLSVGLILLKRVFCGGVMGNMLLTILHYFLKFGRCQCKFSSSSNFFSYFKIYCMVSRFPSFVRFLCHCVEVWSLNTYSCNVLSYKFSVC